MPRPSELPPAFHLRIREWCDLWGVPDLPADLDVRFSGRLTSSMGRCRPSTAEVRLAARLADADPRYIEEVLCHEVAHAAVYRLMGRRVKPHGREWQGLMRAAGFEPTTRMSMAWLEEAGLAEDWTRARAKRLRFEHRCPVCQVRRMARRRMRSWRCVACCEVGLSGKLRITEVEG